MKPPLNKNREFKYPLKRAQRRREPLRTTRELADVVGISVHRLYVLLRSPDAPAPFTRGCISGSYFRPSEFYKWWNSLHIDR